VHIQWTDRCSQVEPLDWALTLSQLDPEANKIVEIERGDTQSWNLVCRIPGVVIIGAWPMSLGLHSPPRRLWCFI
jgi:hypothetical protein